MVKPPYTVTRIGERSVVIMLEPAQKNNSVVVETKKGLVLIDTNLSKSYGEALLAVISEIFGHNDVRFVINTHDDWDHTGGNQAFPTAEIIGHEECHSSLKKDSLETERRLSSDTRECESLISFFGEKLEKAQKGSPEAESLERSIERFETYRCDLAEGQQFIPPSIFFNDRLALDLGDLTLQILYYGKAHRKSDIVVFCPEERFLATGDLIFDMNMVLMPEMGAGYEPPLDIPRWLDVLSTVLNGSHGAMTVVPGHGKLRDFEWLKRRFDYMSALWESVQHEPGNEGLPDPRMEFDATWDCCPENEKSLQELRIRHERLINLFRDQKSEIC